MTISLNTPFYRIGSVAMMAALLVLAGCDNMDTAQKSAAPAATPGAAAAVATVVAPEPPAPPAALSDGIALYNKGSYSAAVKRLANAPEIWSAEI
ncbi:MAG: hypothetical protein ABI171_03425, partial [Collimonas sp.]